MKLAPAHALEHLLWGRWFRAAPPAPAYSVAARNTGIVLREWTIEAKGDLTDAAAVGLLHDLSVGLLRNQAAVLIIDLQTADRADSKLVAALVSIRRQAGAKGAWVQVRPSRQLHRWIELCGLDAALGAP